MKIGFIMGYHSSERIGGSEIQASMLAQNLIKYGHEVFFLCSGDNTKEIDGDIPYEIFRIKETYKGTRIFHYLRKKKIEGILERERPDIIFHRGRIDLADITYRYGKKKGIPTINCITSMRHTQKPRFKISPILPIKVIDHFLLKRSYRLSSIIISQTEEERVSLKRNLGFDSIIIPNGHKIPKEEILKKDKISIIWVANIKPLKQIERFIELSQRFKRKDINFKIIGYFEEREYHDRILSTLNGKDNIEYLGGMDLERTNEFISKASILVQTSEPGSEGFPNTFIQAWLREVPVLSLHSDPDKIITKEKLGFVSGNIEQMVKDLDYLLDNPEVRIEMGKRCREYAIENYDEKKITKKYIDVFNDLLKRKEAI